MSGASRNALAFSGLVTPVLLVACPGESVADIRAAVDAKYSQYGPSNMK